MKNIAILGSTGSIGRQALEVVSAHPDKLRVVAMTGGSNVSLFIEQISRYEPEYVAMSDPAGASELEDELSESGSVRIGTGQQGISAAASWESVDMVLLAIPGLASITPALAAVRAGKTLALASKEAMVCAAELLYEPGSPIIPVDSEHCAIHQCLRSGEHGEVSRLILTASGGAFRGYTAEQLSEVTPRQALANPNWHMGPKVTVDSASLANKGLEVMEASLLFNMPADRIDVVVHPESIVHSMVEYADGAVVAQLAVPDMRLPIQYALLYPARLPSPVDKLNLVKHGTLHFEAPDTAVFSALPLAYRALSMGGSARTVYATADEAAVRLFLSGSIRFTDITRVIEMALDDIGNRIPYMLAPDEQQILEVARSTVDFVTEYANWAIK